MSNNKRTGNTKKVQKEKEKRNDNDSFEQRKNQQLDNLPKGEAGIGLLLEIFKSIMDSAKNFFEW